MKTMQIPINENTGKPLITSRMKAICISEFRFTRQNSCPKCYYEDNENCDVCGGEIDYLEEIIVPWDTCKEIYKVMAMVAHQELE